MSQDYGSAHRRQRRELLRDRPVCVWCRGAPATQADHVPALCCFPPGEWQGQLVPSCAHCNQSRGGKVGAAKRRPPPVTSRTW